MKKKWICTVCGYVHEGDTAPEVCPICKAPAEKFTKQDDEMAWAAEHVVGVAKGVSEDILADLRANFQGECSEVGMYLCMARIAHREGYPEVGLYWEKAAYEEAEHAAKFKDVITEERKRHDAGYRDVSGAFFAPKSRRENVETCKNRPGGGKGGCAHPGISGYDCPVCH